MTLPQFLFQVLPLLVIVALILFLFKRKYPMGVFLGNLLVVLAALGISFEVFGSNRGKVTLGFWGTLMLFSLGQTVITASAMKILDRRIAKLEKLSEVTAK